MTKEIAMGTRDIANLTKSSAQIIRGENNGDSWKFKLKLPKLHGFQASPTTDRESFALKAYESHLAVDLEKLMVMIEEGDFSVHLGVDRYQFPTHVTEKTI
jgi:hypothetical protein